MKKMNYALKRYYGGIKNTMGGNASCTYGVVITQDGKTIEVSIGDSDDPYLP